MALTDETGAQLSDQTAYVWVHRSGDVSYDEYETEIELRTAHLP